MVPHPQPGGFGTKNMANILIVEDEPRMRRLLEISLGEDGHSVQTSADAESGLLHLRKDRS